jgi:hypothetical protein
MARRAQSSSPKRPQSESKVEERRWKTPAVIAAVIAALAAIGVALINQRAAPKPSPSDAPQMTPPMEVNIKASGSGTTFVQTGPGNVHVTNRYEISVEKYDRLREELGVTDSALKSFFKILEQQQVPRQDLDSTLREIAKRYTELQEKLHTFTSNDPAIAVTKREASKALEAGNFERVENC